MLIPETPAMIEYQGRDSQVHRETRILKEELQMDNSIMLYDDKEIFLSDSEKKCCHGKYHVEINAENQ